jgi:hypothetical protein
MHLMNLLELPPPFEDNVNAKTIVPDATANSSWNYNQTKSGLSSHNAPEANGSPMRDCSDNSSEEYEAASPTFSSKRRTLSFDQGPLNTSRHVKLPQPFRETISIQASRSQLTAPGGTNSDKPATSESQATVAHVMQPSVNLRPKPHALFSEPDLPQRRLFRPNLKESNSNLTIPNSDNLPLNQPSISPLLDAKLYVQANSESSLRLTQTDPPSEPPLEHLERASPIAKTASALVDTASHLALISESTIPLSASQPIQKLSGDAMALEFPSYYAGIPTSKLYVKNVSNRVVEEEFRELVHRLCPPNCTVKLLTTGRMKGQAFLTFENIADAESSLLNLHGVVLHGKPLVVCFARTQGQDST